MCLISIVFNLPFNHILYSDLDQSSLTLNPPIINGFERYYKVTDVVGHACVDMIFQSNEERIRSQLELRRLSPVISSSFFIRIHMYV